MDAPFFISKRSDPLRDRSIFKRRSTEAPNVSTNGFSTPQTAIARPPNVENGRGPASPWTAPIAGRSSQQPLWSPHPSLTKSASEFNRSEVARQIKANFDSLIRASPLPQAVQSLVAPTGAMSSAHRPHWRTQPPVFADAARTPVAESSSGMGSPRSHIQPLTATWRPIARPSLPQPGQFASAWPGTSAASPPATSRAQPSPLRRPQPVRAGHGPANAGLLQSVLAGSPAPMQERQMHPAVLNSPDPSSGGDWAWGTPVEEGAGVASQPEAGRGALFHSSRDPRLAARNAADTPGTPQEQGRSPSGQAAAEHAQQSPLAAQMLPRDPRLKGSALGSSPQQHAAWQDPAAGLPALWQSADITRSQPMQQPDACQLDPGVVQSEPMQQTEAEQPDFEVGQAVWALKAADLTREEEPDRLPEALLATGPPPQPQCSAMPGSLGLFPGLPQEEGPQEAAAGSGGALAAEDAIACPGWQVEAFLNDMGSDDEAARHTTAARAGPGSFEAGVAQQQGQDEEIHSELSPGDRATGGTARPDGREAVFEHLLCEEALQKRDGQASSDLCPGKRGSPGRPGAGDGEVDMAQEQREGVQQMHDGQASSELSPGVKAERLAQAVHLVGQLCSDLDSKSGVGAATTPARELSASAAGGPAGGAFGSMPDATDEEISPDAPCAVPALDSAVPTASDSAARAPQLECNAEASQRPLYPAGEPGQNEGMPAALHGAAPGECAGKDVGQQALSPTAELEPPTHMPAPVHSGGRRRDAPVGLAGSRLPPVRSATPEAGAILAHEGSSASGQCSTLTSHTQQPRRPLATPPSRTSQEAASSPSKRPRRAAKSAPTPSRFKEEAAGTGGAHMHAAQSLLAGAPDGQGEGEREEDPLPNHRCAEDAVGDERGEAEAPDVTAHAENADVVAPEVTDLSDAQRSGMVPTEPCTGSDAPEHNAAASRQSTGAQDAEKQSRGRKRKQAPSLSDATNKRRASSRAALSAEQEPKPQPSKVEDNGLDRGHFQVSRTGRVRVKPLAFWANQRLSRDTLAIDQGFSDQLAQQCHSFSPHARPKPSPIKGQPSSADNKSAALQKDAKSAGVSGKGLKRLAGATEAAKPTSKKRKHSDAGKDGGRSTGDTQVVDVAVKDPKAVEPEHPKGKQVRAPRHSACDVCRGKKKGHCGTERAIKGCLRRADNAKTEHLEPVKASSGPDVAAVEAGGLSMSGAQERTLGIQSQLHALSQRKHEPHAAKSQASTEKSKAAGKGSASGNKASASNKTAAVQKKKSVSGAAPAAEAQSKGSKRSGGAGAAERQQPALRRLRKAGESPRDAAAEAAAARSLQDFEDSEDREVSAAHLLAQRFSPSKPQGVQTACGAAGSQRDGTDTSRTETEAATPVRGADEEDEEEDVDGWTQRQRDALQRGHAMEDPKPANFWQRVAHWVPGKSAADCFAKFWAANPTPAPSRAGGPSAYVAAAAAASPLAPPSRTTAAGNVRKLPAAATRRWARQVRWQERASQCADEAPAAGKAPDAKGRHGLNPNLVAAMQRAERTDRYIDAFIRKRGNPQRWQSGSVANGSGRSHTGQSASMPEMSRRPALVNSTVAAIASNARSVPESEDEDSERDEYWSGDDSDS
ncbi:hypothetical protein COCOBI_01-3510 [Coccomyxa sp. Obi]|nr:hypothetical protein COCOBI_01-3510 [Coccomyxa sp. Obi]